MEENAREKETDLELVDEPETVKDAVSELLKVSVSEGVEVVLWLELDVLLLLDNDVEKE